MAGVQAAASRQNWVAVLGVREPVSPEETKKAFRKLARRFHPDRWHATADVETRKLAEATFRLVHEAYEHLTGPPPTEPQRPARSEPARNAAAPAPPPVRPKAREPEAPTSQQVGNTKQEVKPPPAQQVTLRDFAAEASGLFKQRTSRKDEAIRSLYRKLKPE